MGRPTLKESLGREALYGRSSLEVDRKKIAGVFDLNNKDHVESEGLVMDKLYIRNIEKVGVDLMLYTSALGLTSPFELSCNDTVRDVPVLCQNGAILNLRQFLCRAGILMGLADNVKDARSINSVVLSILLKKCFNKSVSELSVPKNEEYIKIIEKVGADLMLYTLALGKTSPFELSCNDTVRDTTVLCQNGEVLPLRTRVCQASIALGLASDVKEAKTRVAELLNILLEKCFERADFEEISFNKIEFLNNLEPHVESHLLTVPEDLRAKQVEARKLAILNLGITEKTLAALEKVQSTLLKVETIKQKIIDLQFRGFKDPLTMINRLPTLLNFSLENIDKKIDTLRRFIIFYALDIDPIIELENHPNWFSFGHLKFELILLMASEKAVNTSEVNGKRISTMFSYNFECLVLAAANSEKGLKRVIRESHQLKKKGVTREERRMQIAALPDDNPYKQRYFKIYPQRAA